jgi:uncharacterized protein YeaC (DUF1315 family)
MEKPKDFHSLLNTIDEDLYQRLKLAVEIGRWANGARLTDSQKALSLQALIAYEDKYKKLQERTGFIAKRDDACLQPHHQNTEKSDTNSATQPLRWK